MANKILITNACNEDFGNILPILQRIRLIHDLELVDPDVVVLVAFADIMFLH